MGQHLHHPRKMPEQLANHVRLHATKQNDRLFPALGWRYGPLVLEPMSLDGAKTEKEGVEEEERTTRCSHRLACDLAEQTSEEPYE